MNAKAAEQAANAIDPLIRAGGVPAALANLELLIEIAQAVVEAKAARDAEQETKDA